MDFSQPLSIVFSHCSRHCSPVCVRNPTMFYKLNLNANTTRSETVAWLVDFPAAKLSLSLGLGSGASAIMMELLASTIFMTWAATLDRPARDKLAARWRAHIEVIGSASPVWTQSLFHVVDCHHYAIDRKWLYHGTRPPAGQSTIEMRARFYGFDGRKNARYVEKQKLPDFEKIILRDGNVIAVQHCMTSSCWTPPGGGDRTTDAPSL